MIDSIERFGYWALQWSMQWDPSLADLCTLAPELILDKRIAITSCDSGPFSPSSESLLAGWQVENGVAISRKIAQITELPSPGFDEWYVFEDVPCTVPTCSFVNQYDFSVLDESAAALSFWEQIQTTKPLHVLGAGTPNMFFVTRDRASFERVSSLSTLLPRGPD